MADNAITLQGLSAITRFIGRSTFQTQDQDLVLGWFVITTNHPLKSWAVWLFPGTPLEKEPPRVCPLERDDSSLNQGLALLDKGDHMVSGLMDNSVVAAFHLRHRSCSDKSSELCLEAEVLNPTIRTFFTMDAIHGKVGLPNFVLSQLGGALLHKTPRMLPGTPLKQFFDVLTARVFRRKIMSLERELAALNRRLNDLKRRQEAIHMRVFTRNHDEPYPADARDDDLIVTIEPPLDWHKKDAPG